jgi:hypothetical protein
MPRHDSSSSHPVHLQLELLEDRCVLSTAAYVSSLYVDLLHRVPASSEVAGWVAAINSGESPSAVALAFTTSPEYLNDTVQAAYQLYLNRQPSPSEAAGWVVGLQNGLPETQLQAAFLASDEFFAQHGGSNLPWLNAVYQKALGRSGGPSELAGWNQVLQSGASRQTVAFYIVTSVEADTRLVTAAYQTLLGRAPDPTGLAYWVSELQHGMTPSQLLAAMASTTEFIARDGGLDATTPPVNRPVPVDTYGEPFLPPVAIFPVGGYTYTPTGFTGGSGGFTGGFSGGSSGGGSGF